MRINTTRFGRIDVDAADVLNFPSGLPGLEDCREWALLADATNDSLGWLHYKRGDYARAIAALERAVASDPGQSVMNEHLGDAYWQVGRRNWATN